MLWLALALSSLVGITLGLLGGGGSIMTLPILRYVLDMDGREAIAMSLVVVGATSLVGMIAHARAGRVRWSTGLIFGAASMAGAYAAGQWLAPLIPATILLILFAVLMAVTAVAMLRKKRVAISANATAAASAPPVLDVPKRPPANQVGRIAGIAGEGIAVGAVTGLVGAGGGFLVVPALVLLGGLPMEHAIGTSLLVIAMKSSAAFAGYASHVHIDWVLTAMIVAVAVAGSFVGAAFAGRIAPDKLRLGFAWFVVAMACFVLLQEVPRQLGTSLHIGWVLLISAATTAALIAIKQRAERAKTQPAPHAITEGTSC
ncbi:MAG: sulfite exporter TauE/SafE family protein [Myxococcales bacterium]|nr:sulfite exporter TauE/SafE family protein [Myxococcales bacterium]